MSKLPSSMENPFDDLIIKGCDTVSTFIRETIPDITPNNITTISFLMGGIGVYFLHKRNIFLFSVFFLLFYILDCLDGFYARKYDMVTRFGDLYDHTKDAVIFLVIMYIVFKNYKDKIGIKLGIFFMLALFFMNLHISLQQCIYSETNRDKIPETIDFFSGVCPDKKWIQYTRFFGTGTFCLIIIGMITYLNYS